MVIVAIYIGIDPGKTGAITIMQTSPDDEVRLLEIHKMPDTEQDIMILFRKTRQDQVINNLEKIINDVDFPVKNMKCILEAQHAFPGMGAGAQWTFAQHYGFLRGVLVSLQIPFIEVSPQKWMGYFGFKREKDEDKKKHKLRILQKAQNLYPHSSVNLQTADSLMICEFLRLSELKN